MNPAVNVLSQGISNPPSSAGASDSKQVERVDQRDYAHSRLNKKAVGFHPIN
jgi:hypothetical protein